MSEKVTAKISSMTGLEKAFLIGTIVWIVLQLTRVIAIVLINDINAGSESEAWRYPAYLDLFAVVFAFPLIWAVWMRRGVATWAAAVVYWSISIVDHVGNFVTTANVGAPSIAEGMEDATYVVWIQTGLDIVFLAALFLPTFRNLFFRVK